MVGKRRRSVLTLGIVAVLMTALLGQSRGFLAETAASWTDAEHTSASVTSGAWPTAGYGIGSAARLTSAGGVSILPTNPTPLPWNGARNTHDATLPGTSTVPGTGPFATSAVARVNQLVMSGAASASAVGATACASYVLGATGVPSYCTTVGTPTASASASVTSLRLTGSIVALSLLGVISLVNTNIVTISTAAEAITASVGCDLVNGTNTPTRPAAGNVTGPNPNGSVLVGGTSVRIPNANSTTTVASIIDGLVGYTGVQLSSSTSAANVAAGFSKLTLSGTVSLLSLGLLSMTFSIDLVNAQCGSGSTPAALDASQPLARVATQPEASAVVATSVPVSSVQATSEPETTTPSATPPSTDGAVAAPTPETTTTTGPPAVDAAEPSPVEMTEPPPPTTTMTAPTPTTTTPTTSQPPQLPTVFTGPTEGNVEVLTFADDVVCTASAEADYTGTVELTCEDGTSITAVGSALTPAQVAAATVDGVWAPVLTAEGAARPVVAAIRG